MKRLAWAGVAAGAIAIGAAVLMIRADREADRPVEDPRVVRGAILDYDGNALTASREIWQASLDVRALRAMPAQEAADFLREYASRLGLRFDLEKHLQDRTKVVHLQLPARLSALQMRNVTEWFRLSRWQDRRHLISFMRKDARAYPFASVFAPLLGFVGIDGDGLEGLELQFDDWLEDGHSIRLGVTSTAQIGLTDKLREAMSRSRAADASAVAIEILTGRVTALVSLPSYDPADLALRTGPNLRLRPMTHLFQAGPMLQPFLAYAVLTDSRTQDAAALARFESLDPDAGSWMATMLGYEPAMAGLSRSGLLTRRETEFPAPAATRVRGTGSIAARLRDLGNGAGVAPSLFQYSAALADLLAGSGPRPAPLSVAHPAGVRREPQPTATEYAAGLRNVLVKRARRQSGDDRADYGGMWAIYTDRIENGSSAKRSAVLALFAPADEPRHLLVIRLTDVVRALDEDALLRTGTAALSALTSMAGR